MECFDGQAGPCSSLDLETQKNAVLWDYFDSLTAAPIARHQSEPVQAL